MFMSCDILTNFSSSLVRDTAGTALYFLEYDGMRHLLGRQRSGEQGPTPSWLPVPASLVPFVCGSVSGVMLHDALHVCRIDHFGRLLHGLLFTPWMCKFLLATISIGLNGFELVFRVKTKVQQRSLAGERYRGPLETLHRLIRGTKELHR